MVDNPIKKNSDTPNKMLAYIPTKKNLDILSKRNVDAPTQKTTNIVVKETQTDSPPARKQKYICQKYLVEKQDALNLNKTETSFSIKHELEKLKIYIPPREFMNKRSYRSQVMKDLVIGEDADRANVSNHQP